MEKKDYRETVHYILDTDPDEIKELENGNFSSVKKLDFWFTYHHFEPIFAILKGSTQNYNEKILHFLSLLATSLSHHTQLKFETIHLIHFAKYYSREFLNIDIDEEKIKSLSQEELIEFVQNLIGEICKEIQTRVDEVQDTMKNQTSPITQEKRPIDGLHEEDIDCLFQNYQLQDLIKRLNKYSESIDFDTLSSIYHKTQALMNSSFENHLTKEELIQHILCSGTIPSPWLHQMSQEELAYEFHLIVLKRCKELRRVILSIGSKDDSNSMDDDEKQNKIQYLADALKYGAITNSVHHTCKTHDTIESLLFKKGISSWEIPGDVLEASDKRLLASRLLSYIDKGDLIFQESIQSQLPDCFHSCEKVFQQTKN